VTDPKTVARTVKRLLRAFPGSFVMPQPRPTRPRRTPDANGNSNAWTEPRKPPSDAQVAARIAGYPKCRLCRRPLCLGQPDVHYLCAKRNGTPRT
jgi:hypothetical protein